MISKFSPMWTNKQVWEFEQVNEDLKFDAVYVAPSTSSDTVISWNSNQSYTNSNIRDTILDAKSHLVDGDELWIAGQKLARLDTQYIPYIMAVAVDSMIDDEICLNFRFENDDSYLVISTDYNTDVIDCKEFFEEFYHLATGFNYDTDTGIPDDQTEAAMYLARLQEEFDGKMRSILGEKYMPGNNDPENDMHAQAHPIDRAHKGMIGNE